MSGTAAVTVVTSNYLHWAIALGRSLRETNPSLEYYIVIADAPPSPAVSEFKCLLAVDLFESDRWARFAFGYTPLELCCALKPWALQHVLQQGNYESVIYVDADLVMYASLEGITRSLRDHHILLTPHLARPTPGNSDRNDEQRVRRAGTYNGGFVGVRNSAEGRAFLEWWSGHLVSQSIHDLSAGLTADQSWLDLVPGLFDGVHIERGQGYNVAYWNLSTRRLEIDESGRPTVNGEALIFFHFSGFRRQQPERLSSFSDQVMPADSAIRDLAMAYAELLADAGADAFESTEGVLSCLSDGTPIEREWREAIRLDHEALRDIEDPFDVDANPNLVERFSSVAKDLRFARGDWYFDQKENLQREAEWLRKEVAFWKEKYTRLAEAFPLGFLLRLRRKILGLSPGGRRRE